MESEENKNVLEVVKKLLVKKKSNPRKMAKLQVQVKHFVTYTYAASQLTNFE